MRRSIVRSAAVLAFCAAGSALAQTFPSRPILLIAPFSTGTAVDFVARLIANKFSEDLKVPMVVENRLGAAGQLGTAAVAKAAPDGHTLLYTSPAHYINRSLFKNLPYDPEKDFVPVMRVSNALVVLVVARNAPVSTQAELVAYAKARPGQLGYSTAGSGSATHLPTALFNSMAGLDMIHVPYKSGAQAMTDVISGQVFMTSTAITTALGHIRSGALKAIGVSGSARSLILPDVPTIAEGGQPGYEFVSWNGMFAPAGTPPAVLTRLEGLLNRVVNTPDFRERLLGAGVEPEILGPAAFAARLQTEIPYWAKVVQLSGAKAE